MDIAVLRNKAKDGNVAAQTILGICYLDGIDVEADYHEALRLLSAAAGSGASRAMLNLARIHSEGLGTAKNLPEAMRLYEAAAKAGEFLAQITLGRIYASGTDIPANPDQARVWYSLALAQEGQMADCQEIQEAKNYVRAGRLDSGN
ncbi:MAG: tetratricopeptide repeat protein [Candidatus Korobacteraceae bacterium]